MRVKTIINDHLTNPANWMTTIGMYSGLISLFLMAKGLYFASVAVYMLTLLLDLSDGIVARKLNRSSSFGAELDSLSDAVNFGIIPVCLAYSLGFDKLWMLVLSLFYITAVLWRLACFNDNEKNTASGVKEFSGVPSTASAAVFFLILTWSPWFNSVVQIGLLSLFFPAFAILMVSPLKYKKYGIITQLLFVTCLVSLLILRVYYGPFLSY